MRGIFVVATGQHVGKTTVAIGLISLLKKNGLAVNFCKPVGQEYVECDNYKVDKDALLIQSALHIEGKFQDMSPITVPRGFVEQYLFNPDVNPLKKKIQAAFEHLSKEDKLMVVEGTGHAGVGSCFDLSNADVAEMLGLPVILVAEGGIGSTLDQVALNVNLFRSKKVEIMGVVANKVLPDKIERVAGALEKGLANMGLKFLGAIPYEPKITYPRISQIVKALSGQVLCGEEALNERFENVLVAAMEPQNVLPWIAPNSLMITPGDRIDNVLVALSSRLIYENTDKKIIGIILTGGLMPHFTIIGLLKKSNLPVIICKESTYAVSTRVKNLVFKILPEDTDKIEVAKNLMEQHLNIKEIMRMVL